MSNRSKRFPVLTLATAIAATSLPVPAHAAVTLLDKDQWKVTMGGFVEMDTISDSVRSFTEVIGNTPVDRPETINGAVGRTQFSIRNTRLDFGVEAPEVDGWKTRGYLEFDLLGYDPGTTLKSAGGGASVAASTNTEGGFFDNPALRVRHAYISAESDGWQLMAGQYWALLGWQPDYFMPSVQVAPVPAMLYSRTPQLRAVKTLDVADGQTLQAAIGVMRPPQRDAEYPGLELGARWALASRASGFTGGASGAMKAQPMSVGISGAFRELSAPQNPTATPSAANSASTDYPGTALAIDALIPVLASSDGKDVSNTLTLGGEFTVGTGYGDEFNSWTGNLPSPLNSGSSPYSNINLDAGIGGYNSADAFSLIHLTTWNTYLQYHLNQAARTAFALGASQLYSSNVDSLMSSSPGKVFTYDREQAAFVNMMHDFSDQIRVGVEYAFIRTTYSDGEMASDNRYQVSFWYIF